MCLTEPHCGTDLGLLKTRAVPQADGSHAISGTKIFITAGEHDFTDNIVHLVLARLPDAPAGSKGISMFIVPKQRVDRDGNVGARNGVRCGAIEHKMGIHGSATCVINFDDAQGWLIGQPNKGLAAMFTMMNTARLAVGLQGLGLSDRAYQNALAYSRDRLQMRSLSGAKFPDKPADPIIVHPDVRRMLLTCKALAEGGRLLGYHGASLVDVVAHTPDAEERAQADVLLGFLTPIVKACLTEWGVECTYHALQCFGGHGYIHEHGMEQFARDARITTLYEGTTGIQALDLMGRKIVQQQGAGLRVFLGMIEQFCEDHAGNAAVAEFVAPLRETAALWQQITLQVGKQAMANAGRDRCGRLRLPVLFRLCRAGVLVGAQRRGSGSLFALRSVQGRQARDRALLLRADPAADDDACRGDRERRRHVDGAGWGPFRRLSVAAPRYEIARLLQDVVVPPPRRCRPHAALEAALERGRRIVADRLGDHRDAVATFAQSPRGEQDAPAAQVLHRRLADGLLEALGEARARCRQVARELVHGPRSLRCTVQQRQRTPDQRIAQSGQPAGLHFGQRLHVAPQRFDEHQFGHAQTQAFRAGPRRKDLLLGISQQWIERWRHGICLAGAP